MSTVDVVANNKCEVCGKQATGGFPDGSNKVRYACDDHHMQVYEQTKESK